MIKWKNVNKIYNQGKENEFHAIKDVNMEIEDGEFVAITGKSGAGKTTMFRMLAGLEDIQSGTYELDHQDLSKYTEEQFAKIRNEKIGIIFQNYALVENESVMDNVILPAYFTDLALSEARAKAETLLEELSLKGMEKKKVYTLSGGQKQRVAIARALLLDPQYILADEPTGALDEENGDNVMALLQNINERGKTVLIITHNSELAVQCGRKIHLEAGQVKDSCS